MKIYAWNFGKLLNFFHHRDYKKKKKKFEQKKKKKKKIFLPFAPSNDTDTLSIDTSKILALFITEFSSEISNIFITSTPGMDFTFLSNIFWCSLISDKSCKICESWLSFSERRKISLIFPARFPSNFPVSSKGQQTPQAKSSRKSFFFFFFLRMGKKKKIFF